MNKRVNGLIDLLEQKIKLEEVGEQNVFEDSIDNFQIKNIVKDLRGSNFEDIENYELYKKHIDEDFDTVLDIDTGAVGSTFMGISVGKTRNDYLYTDFNTFQSFTRTITKTQEGQDDYDYAILRLNRLKKLNRIIED